MKSPSIYIDTNIFLDFYQAAKDRMEIFRELLERADNIVVPEQTVREFRRNRAARLTWLAEQVKKDARMGMTPSAIVHGMPAFKEWTKARDQAQKHSAAIVDQLLTWARDDKSDPVYQEFVKLYVYGTTMSTPADALRKAQERKLLGNPPTSPDKHSVGDEVIWETLLAFCEGDLIVVSRDRTFLDNVSILREEYQSGKSRRLVAITDKLGEALKLVGKPSKPIERAENDKPLSEDELQRARATGVCPRCSVELEEQGYEGDEGDSAWWMTCPKCGRDVFPEH